MSVFRPIPPTSTVNEEVVQNGGGNMAGVRAAEGRGSVTAESLCLQTVTRGSFGSAQEDGQFSSRLFRPRSNQFRAQIKINWPE